jgi:hypothetical protein
MLPPTNGVADAVYERMRLLEQEARESRSTLTQQATTMDSLVRQTAAMDADRDATADYEINAQVLALGSKYFLGKAPLFKAERRATSRNHQGVYPDDGWPNGLAMKEPTRNSSDMQKAKKLALPQCAVEVSNFLEWNAFTTKMTGSALSLVIDVKQQMIESLTSDPGAWHRADDIVTQLDEICCVF